MQCYFERKWLFLGIICSLFQYVCVTTAGLPNVALACCLEKGPPPSHEQLPRKDYMDVLNIISVESHSMLKIIVTAVTHGLCNIMKFEPIIHQS